MSIKGELLDSSSSIHRHRKKRKLEKLSQDEESENSFMSVEGTWKRMCASSSADQVVKTKKKKKSKHKEK